MKHLFLPYPLALKAKEKGFNEECLAVYPGDSEIKFSLFGSSRFINDKSSWVTAPLYQQIVDWLRQFKIKVVEHPSFNCKKDKQWFITHNNLPTGFFETKDEAIEQALNLIE